MEYMVVAFVLAGFSIFLTIFIVIVSSKLGKAKKTLENYKIWSLQLWQMLKAYSTLVTELQRLGLAMDKRYDDVSSYIAYLKTRERRPSGIEICVQATFPSIKYNSIDSPSLFISVRFPHENEKVWGVPALKQEVAKATKNRFKFPNGNCELQQVLQFNLVGVAGQIADAVRFYEESMVIVGQEALCLEALVQEAERTGEELGIKKTIIQNRINDMVASLGGDQKATVAG
ncbi:MAG: hypothetical protein Q8P69_01710 [bacterium]|nr:hypothetical protein [bacterium]